MFIVLIIDLIFYYILMLNLFYPTVHFLYTCAFDIRFHFDLKKKCYFTS